MRGAVFIPHDEAKKILSSLGSTIPTRSVSSVQGHRKAHRGAQGSDGYKTAIFMLKINISF